MAHFEVHYYRPAGGPLGPDEMELFARTVGDYKMTYDPADGVARYLHPDTGIAFEFAQIAPDAVPPEFRAAGSPSHAGVVCRVPLNRASIIGAEAVPIMLILGQRFRLLIKHAGAPTKPPAVGEQNALMEAWLDANVAAKEAAEKAGGETRYAWAHEDLAVWYRYQLMRVTLEKKMTDSGYSVAVPRMRLVRDTKADNAIRTMIEWPEYQPTIFPPVNLLRMRREKKTMLGLKKTEIIGWAALDDVRRAIANLVHKIGTDGGDVYLLGENQAKQAPERVDQVPLNTDIDRFAAVRIDEIIDV